MSVLTPNMNLIESTVGVDNGIKWEQNLNASLTILDGHDHSPGYGVPINPNGLNINSDLSFLSNNATNLRSARFSQQSAVITASDLNCIYVLADGNLYYNDGVGNPPIQITLGGAVNATSSGISSGTASAAFSGGVLQVYANASNTTPADILCASVLIGDNTPSSNFVKLSAPAALAADYTLTFPAALPASQKIVTMSAAGNIAAAYDVDNVTLEVDSNLIQVKDGGVTPDKMGLINFGESSPTNAPNFTNTSFLDVTGLTVTLTTFGNPVWVGLVASYTTPFTTSINVTATSGASVHAAVIQIKRDGVAVAEHNLAFDSASVTGLSWPVGGIYQVDTALASTPGTYVYIIAVKVTSGTNLSLPAMKLVAYEL